MENKKNSKKGIIITIVVVLIVLAGAGCWFTGLVGGISEAEAKQIAADQIADDSKADSVLVNKEFDDGRMVYNVQIIQADMLYEFQMLARNGKITESSANRTGTENGADRNALGSSQNASANTDIGAEKAKEIALSNVKGASAKDITETKADSEDGRMVYEIEIRYDKMDYDFEIDAATGEILKQSSESVHN